MVVLVAALDWGLGHATRCIPVIRALERAGHVVVPCAGGAGLRLLRAEFPHLHCEPLRGHAMRYARNRALLLPVLLAQLPLFAWSSWRDRRAAARLARKHGAGFIISDGRYGFRAAGIPSVFVSHQLDIIPPGPAWLRRAARPLVRVLNRAALAPFAEVWVPDFAGAVNLSGTLGHPAKPWPRARYIRPLCRFLPPGHAWSGARAAGTRDAAAGARIDVLALLSGPEPQRGVLEARLRAALEALPGTRVLVRGVPGAAAASVLDVTPGGFTVFDHLPGDALRALLRRADGVVARSGYTTVMELAGLGQAGVLFVPTPGQPEQEALAIHARALGLAAWQDQDAFDLAEGLRAARALPGFARVAEAVEGGDPDWNLADWIAAHPLLRGA